MALTTLLLDMSAINYPDKNGGESLCQLSISQLKGSDAAALGQMALDKNKRAQTSGFF